MAPEAVRWATTSSRVAGHGHWHCPRWFRGVEGDHWSEVLWQLIFWKEDGVRLLHTNKGHWPVKCHPVCYPLHVPQLERAAIRWGDWGLCKALDGVICQHALNSFQFEPSGSLSSSSSSTSSSSSSSSSMPNRIVIFCSAAVEMSVLWYDHLHALLSASYLEMWWREQCTIVSPTSHNMLTPMLLRLE